MPVGIALHIGLNKVSRYHPFVRDLSKLNCAVKDAYKMSEISRQNKYMVSDLMIQKQAKKRNIVKNIIHVAKILEDGDQFLLTFSGHGVRNKDWEEDDSDGFDEGWCVWDSIVTDDELTSLLRRFKKGVKVVVISDCCYAKGIIDLDKRNSQNDQNAPSVLLLAASDEQQFAYEFKTFSAFTFYLIKHLNEFIDDDNYERLFGRIKKSMEASKNQTPILKSFGPFGDDLIKEKPLQIQI